MREIAARCANSASVSASPKASQQLRAWIQSPSAHQAKVSDVGVIANEILNFAPIATRLCARERVWLQLATCLATVLRRS